MSPAGANLSSRHAQFFDQLCSITLDNGLVVNKFRSRRTGLHVILARVEGPIVSGYFTLATEALDDDGLPHTLEHLVFLGSEKYPYKGVLDLLANRCLASGTNAWTDTDHTAFTIETAGSEGFLNHLPIYLDHLLYPTLTDASFKTEVYHVTGDGEDAGVVYSEMQSRENSGADRSFLALQRAFYPEPECGYKYETGGLMFNLRNSTTNEKIRAYHREFYRPENLHLIITGQVEASKLFEVLIKFEESILAKGPRPPFTRPWQRPVAPLMASVRKEVVYPSNTEDNGRVLVAWRGPSASKDYRQLLSLSVLMEFLTHSSISALPAAFVEIHDPLASEVSHYVSENQASNCYLKFTGVPLEHMEMVEPLMRTTLENLYSGTDGDGIDLAQMREFLSHLILTQLSELETSPRDTLAYAIIGDALYGNTCQDLEHRVDKVSWYRVLLTQPLSFWRDLLRQFLLDQPSVVVLARPSAAEAERLHLEEEELRQERVMQLGREGLERKQREIDIAESINEIPPPSSMLSSLPIPSPASVVFHSVEAYNNHPSSDASRATLTPDPPFFPLSKLPLRMQLDHLNTKFVTLTAVLDSSMLSTSDRLYLPLLLELFFESSLLKNGTTLMPYETVIRRLSAEMVEFSAEMGLSLAGTNRFACGPFCNYLILVLKFKWSRYSKGVSWLEDVLYHQRPTVDRLKIKTAKLLNSIDDYSREASKILSLMHRGVIFKNESNQNQINLVRQLEFLRHISDRLEDPTSAQEVLQEVTDILKVLSSPETLTVHMAANFKQLVAVKDVVQPWLSFVKDRTFQHSAQPLHVVTDSSARMFSGVLPFDMPSQPPVRRLDLNEDRRIPVDDEHDTHLKEKIKKHDQEEEIKSLGKSIGSVLDSNNDLSQLTLEPEISEDDNRFEEIPFDENFDEVQLKNANNTQAVTKGSNIIESLRNSSTAVETESSLTVHGAIHEATAWVYGLPAADSGYLQQTAVSITQYTHWHLPALLTAIQFFTQLEGPLWREIRGRGLAYNYELQLLPSDGLITLKLTRASQLLTAYEETLILLRSYINGSRDWDPLLLESAKSSLMFDVIYREDTVADVVQQSLLSYYRQVSLSYNRELLSMIAGVSLAEVQWVAKHYLTPLLHPSSSRTVVVCHPSEVNETIAALTSMGHEVEEVVSLAESRFS